MIWLPKAERIVTGTSGGSYKGGPFRITLHRTEGSSIEGALSVYRRINVAPHLTVDLKKRRIAQHTPFDVASRALQNLPGGVETNRRSNIQIEIVGFSRDAAQDSDDDLRWFGREVLGPIMREYRIFGPAPRFYGEGAGWILASAKAKQRMSYAEWNRFNGVCSHQHVPEQSHWDCGEFKIDVALAATKEDDVLSEQFTKNPYSNAPESLDVVIGQMELRIREGIKRDLPALIAKAVEDSLPKALLSSRVGTALTVRNGITLDEPITLGQGITRAAEASVVRQRDEAAAVVVGP